MNSPELPIAIMVAHLRQAKKAEAEATAFRRSIEAQIVARFPVPVGGEGKHKDEEFVIEYGVSRKLDTAAIQANWETISAAQQKALRWKAEIDLKNYRALQEFEPEEFASLAKYVTTTPSKPAISLTEKE